MRSRSFEEQIVAAVTAAWANAIPMVSLQVLWGRGEVAPVYAIAGAMSPKHRPAMLAWFSAQDPEPDAPRAVRAAREALQQVQSSWSRIPLVALVPLANPSVLQVARRLAEGTDRKVIGLRLGSAADRLPEVYEPGAAIVRALHAAWLAEQGRGQEAAEALEVALAEPVYDAATGLALIPTIRRLDGWSRVPETAWDETARMWAAFVAGQVDVEAAERLLQRWKGRELYVSAALGAGRPAEAWRERMRCTSEAQLEEWYAEGLISRGEQWTSRVGAALVGPCAYRDTTSLVLASLVEARKSARGFTEDVAERRSGPPRDEERLAKQRRRVEKSLASPSDEEKISARTLRPFLRPARALAELGAADVVREAVEALERRWGPAERWGRGEHWNSASIVEPTLELLACAEGRALAALRLSAGEDDLPAAVRAQICVGLARDGQVAELREPLEKLLAGPLEPGDVASLVPAALAVDPAAGETIVQAAERALEALPGTPEAAEGWLEQCARAALRAERDSARRRGSSPRE